MLLDYLPVFLMVAVAIGLCLFIMALGSLFRPSNP